MTTESSIIKKGHRIEDDYEVILFIKKGLNAETYRVRGPDGKLYFLKLFKYSNLPPSSFDEKNDLLESEILSTLKHRNIVSYIDSGELIIDGSKMGFLVEEFIPGETIEQRLVRGDVRTIYDVKQIIRNVLEALNYLHEQDEPIIHNAVNAQNIMLDLSSGIQVAKLIDFGHARFFYQSSGSYYNEGLNPFYIAPESFYGIFSPQTDLFSAGALAYHLLCGIPPWHESALSISRTNTERAEILKDKRTRALTFNESSKEFPDYDPKLPVIIKKALQSDSELRFKSAQEFLDAVNGVIEIEEINERRMQKLGGEEKGKSNTPKKKTGRGFEAIAGMTELKDQLQLEIVNAIKNPEEYKRYGVTLPNGMLLYGPPGCGKTYFSKCLAEEVGFNFIDIKPSSLQSKWINATQENISNMFKTAEENAPTFIFIDELDALVPSRDMDLNQMHSNAVNEFLAQMNNLGERGIFVVGATNRPDRVDPAILRTGRLDKKIYVPPPDHDARKALFEMYLKERPLDFGIDYDELARRAENYVTSDIQFLVNEGALRALKEKSRISMKTLLDTIEMTKPSVAISELRKYEVVRSIMESEISEEEKKNPFGFELPNKKK